MNRIKIVPREGLQKERRFQLSVQLSRLVNAIQANKRHYRRIREKGDPASFRDQIELILYHAAIVFEAVATVTRHSQDLSKLATWSRHADLVKRLQTEANDRQSFTQKYLKRIRNKVSFHYDAAAIESVLSGFLLTEDTSFAESKSGYDRELAFVLADEVLLHYAISPIDERDTDNERWDYFQETLLSVSDGLVELLLLLTIELARDFTVIEEVATENRG